MQLERIITMASGSVRLPFLAMERSLRATGCDLPLWVIPYNEERFDLPPNATWWEIPEVSAWLDREIPNQHRFVKRKYQCLLTDNFQFVDADVIFLRNPTDVLRDVEGWVLSCTHWSNPAQTTTAASRKIMQRENTTWPQRIFNTGQFASDRALYDFTRLQKISSEVAHRDTILSDRFHEQPGINLLVFLAGIETTNLTLPPHRMESTWAGDYREPDFRRTWSPPDRCPYLIHWAGLDSDQSLPINALMHQFLTASERDEWLEHCHVKAAKNRPNPVRNFLWKVRETFRS